MTRLSCIAVVIVGLLAVGVDAASSQNSQHTNRSFVPAPEALGMGDAGVALPSAERAFFYNPAHIGRVARPAPRITVAGVNAALSTATRNQVDFYADRLQPALDRGIDALPEDSLRSLYQDTFDQGRQRAGLGGHALLPSIIIGGGGAGLGSGLFASGDVNYRIRDAGLGVPLIDMVGRTDLMAVGSGALTVRGLTVGATAKYTQRYLNFLNKPIDAIEPDEELFLLRGTSIGIDVGLLYDLDLSVLPGVLRIGGTVYDALATSFDYRPVDTPEDTPVLGSILNSDAINATDPATEAERVAYAMDHFDIAPSYRVGLGYRALSFGVVNTVDIAVDYLGYVDPPIEQSFWTRWHAGLSVQALRVLHLRAGLSQGYPAWGAGLRLGIIHLDYAFHSVEDGRLPGQSPHTRQTAQVRLTF